MVRYRGAARTADDAVRLAVEGWHGGTTLSDANSGLTGEPLAAKIGTAESRGARAIAVGDEAVHLWATLVSYAADIEAQQFPYIPYALPGSPFPTINSSSLVASLLHHAGLDIGPSLPFGTRFSPGTATLLGTSRDETLSAANGLTTVVAGDGDDTISGSFDARQTDKLFGGRGDDTFHWSDGFNIVHGGQPGLAYAEDGTDTIDYAGASVVTLEATAAAAPHFQPDFIATHSRGIDHLFSIEEIAWDDGNDRLIVGRGVGLATAPLKIDFRGETEEGQGDVLDLSAADTAFDVRPETAGGLRLSARFGASAADHGLDVVGTEWIVGSTGPDTVVAAAGLRGVEGGDGDDLIDVRLAAPAFVSGGEGADVVIVGKTAVAACGGNGRDRFAIAEAAADLDILDPTPLDRIALRFSASQVAASYDIAAGEDLIIHIIGETGSAGVAQIKIRDFHTGDLGLDLARGLDFDKDNTAPDLDGLTAGRPSAAEWTAAWTDVLEAGFVVGSDVFDLEVLDMTGVSLFQPYLPFPGAVDHG